VKGLTSESGVVKIQNGDFHKLTEDEMGAVSILREDNPGINAVVCLSESSFHPVCRAR
jgi:hypothetical protein